MSNNGIKELEITGSTQTALKDLGLAQIRAHGSGSNWRFWMMIFGVSFFINGAIGSFIDRSVRAAILSTGFFIAGTIIVCAVLLAGELRK